MDEYCADLGMAFGLLQKKDPVDPELKTMVSAMHWTCDSNQSSYWFQRGIANYNLGKYARAVDYYTQGLRKFPGNSMTLSFRGNAHYALQHYEEAIKDYRASIASRDNVAADLRTNPKYEFAPLDSLQRYINGFIASMQISMAESYFGLGMMDQALIEINKGLEIAAVVPGFGLENYYNVRGNVFMGMGRYEEAKGDFNRVLSINPKDYRGMVNLAVAKANLGTSYKVKTSSLSIGYNAANFQPSWTLPLSRTVKKDDYNLQSALLDLNAAINIDPSNPFAWYIRGQVKQALGLPDYCKDISTARKLGFPKEQDGMTFCP